MGKGIFIIGTDTDVGKTFITAGITYKLIKGGYNAISFKPIQSGGIIEESTNLLIPPDIKYIKDICNIDCDYKKMNTYCLKEEVSPHLAAKIENVEIIKEKIINQYNELINEYEFVIVEGAGGIVVPLIDNTYFVYDLIKDLNIDVVIVSRADVGTINHTVLTNEFLKKFNINAKGIFINKYHGEFYEDDNIRVIKDLTKIEMVHTVGEIKEFTIEDIKKEYEKFDLEKLLNLFS